MIIITGMHRSGTSAVCNILMELGVDFGDHEDFLPADKWNAKGYFENRDVFLINNSVIAGLQRLQRLWMVPYHKRSAVEKILMLPVKARYLMMPHTRKLAERMERMKPQVREVGEKIGRGAVKDPRFCLLLKPWCRHAAVDKVLFSHRHPAEVVRSLNRREGLPVWLGYRFWAYHVGAFLEQMDELGMEVAFVNYNRLFDPVKQEEEAERLFRFAGREFDSSEWKRVAAASFDGRLRHHENENVKLPRVAASVLADLENRFQHGTGL